MVGAFLLIVLSVDPRFDVADILPQVVLVERARLLEKRELRGGHLRIWVDVGGAPLSCFGGDMAPLAPKLGAYVSMVGALRRDTWQGGGAVEMRLVAAESA